MIMKALDLYKMNLQAENFSEKTQVAYLGDLEQFFSFVAKKRAVQREKLELAQVDSLLVRGFVHDLMIQGVSKRSVARKLSSIRSFYSFAVREMMAKENPALLIRAPKNTPDLPRFLYREHMDKLFQAQQSLGASPPAPQGAQRRAALLKEEFVLCREQVLLELLYGSGLRVSELVSLNLGHIDQMNKLVRVMGKGRKERIVPMTDMAVRVIHGYLCKREEMRFALAAANAPLLLNLRGGRLTTQSVRRILNDCEKKAQLNQHIHPHMLRHTYATHLLDGGADLRSVQELLGHKNLSSTQIYTHLTKERLRQTFMDTHPRAKLEGEEERGGMMF